MASASVFLMNLDPKVFWAHLNPNQSHINVGYGSDVSIADLATTISEVVGYKGRIIFDTTKPDGAPRKLMDSGVLRSFGWSPKIDLITGLKKAYASYLADK